MGRMTLDALTIESGYGKRSLQRYFSQYLSQTPVLELRRGE
jgi:transcriptional regulator GlxA family with amidase domain